MPQKVRNLIELFSNNNDESAFTELYKNYYPGLKTYAFFLLKERSAAEDVVQDVFVKVWFNRTTLASVSNFHYYLFTATKHTAFNYLSKRSLNKEHLLYVNNKTIFPEEDPELSVIHKENLFAIENAVNSLPRKCSIVFKLIKEEGLSYREAAQLLDLSQKTIEAHMSLAYNHILQAIQEHLPEYSRKKKRTKTS